ncbi:helicase C-terminal domain-containing protein [Entophlyctis helioformis]|nr:helicase C-terminal domain-containing protein [Entophlyctis helioformis]
MTTTTAQGTGGTQTLAVLGVSVRFPHSPYPQQLQLMATIIRSLQNGENGLVESPTGTGKTLCLLCATLAWCEAFALWRSKAALWLDLKDRAGSAAERAALLGDLNTLSMAAFGKPHNESLTVVPGVPRVLYSSRTHSQLSQVVSELKNTSYNVSSSVLGSREQMCINPSVKAAPSAAHAAICRTKVAKKTCEFHVASQKPSIVQGVEAKIMDIEDLVSYGQTQKACPYFLSKEILNKVDITFLPYNYLVDPHTRSQQLELKNSILIFDEGHNLESSCSDASSFDLVTQDLEQAIAEVEICTNIASSSNFDESLLKGLSVNDMGTLKRLISDFIAKIRAMELPKNNDNSLIKPAEFLITLFEELNVKRDTYVLVVKVIDVCLDVLASDLGKMRSRLCLGQFKNALTTTFRVDKGGSSVLDHYRVHIQAIKDIKQPTAAAGRLPVAVAVDSIKLSFWCFSSGVAMQALVGLGVRSVLLASGTLSPLHSFAHELAIPFPNQLENTHVINPSQIFVGVVPKGPSGATLSSSYSNRDNDSYVPDLGNAVVNFVRIVPDGVLVFFTAYKIMRDCIDAWKMPSKKAGAGQKTIWQRMAEHKTLFVEPRDKHEFTAAINEYERTIEQSSGKGAVFFAVCRGKASEGLDFSDRKARAVVICGIPYPASKEPKVILKRGILDHELRTKKAGMSGHDWYAQQAARAVNQAIGRVIRHKNDYGAVLLCDERFSKEHVQGQLPVWVRPNVKVMTQFGDAQSQLTHFFRNMTMNSDWPVSLSDWPCHLCPFN